jgi:ABC-type transporter Mla MlaB component
MQLSCAGPDTGLVVTVELSRPEHDRVHVRVSGALDSSAAVELSETRARVLRESPRRLDLDLSAVTTCTSEGIAAVTECLLVGRGLDDGVGVTVATDAGRRALLESMATV